MTCAEAGLSFVSFVLFAVKSLPGTPDHTLLNGFTPIQMETCVSLACPPSFKITSKSANSATSGMP